jgi:hypothetical protein
MSIVERIERVNYTVRLWTFVPGVIVIVAAVLLAFATGETGFGVLGVFIGAAIIAGGFYILKEFSVELPHDGEHYFIRHRKSGDWGLFSPNSTQRIPFLNQTFTAQKIDYQEHPEVIEGKLDYPGATYKAAFTWKPDREHLDVFAASLDPTAIVRDLCAYAAERSAGDHLIKIVSLPGEPPPLSPWGMDGLKRMAARRELWEDGLKTTFDPPDLSRWGVKMASLCELTIIPPPPLEDWEDYVNIHIGNENGAHSDWLDEDDLVHRQSSFGG